MNRIFVPFSRAWWKWARVFLAIFTVWSHSAAEQVLFQQPSITQTNALARIVATTEMWDGFKLRWGFKAPTGSGEDLSKYTGLSVPADLRPYYQLASGPMPLASTWQAFADTIGMWLNSTGPHFPGRLLPMTPAHDWPESSRPAVFEDDATDLSISFESKLPFAKKEGYSEIYGSVYFLFHHAEKGLAFWYGASFFDLRGRPSEYVILDAWEAGTGLPIVNSTFADNTTFTHRGPNSTSFQARPWQDFKYFDMRASKTEFARALAALSSKYPQFGATQPRDFRLAHINLNPELYVEKNTYVFIQAENRSGYDQRTRVYFRPSPGDIYKETNSVEIAFPSNKSSAQELVVNFSSHPAYHGLIRSIRIVPLTDSGEFAIRGISIGTHNRHMVHEWDFKKGHGPHLTFTNISNPRVDSGAFLGLAENNLSALEINKEFHVDQSFDQTTRNSAKLGISIRKLRVALVPHGRAEPDRTFSQIIIKAANGTGSPETLQVFFKTAERNFYSEEKSTTLPLPAGGGYVESIADFSDHPLYKGRITGVRIDPITSEGAFGIEYIRIVNGPGEWVYKSEFNGQSRVANPFMGWTLSGITSIWADGSYWGGKGTEKKDPAIYRDFDFDSGR